MPKIILSSGAEFESKPNATILASAAMSNIVLPYSCRSGRCSACKCKILYGQTYPLLPELGLSENEKNNGWILSCVRVAETDLSLDLEDLGKVALPVTRTLPCRVSSVDLLTANVAQVTLRLPPKIDFSFIPGQYIDVIGPEGVRRSYSLANSSFQEKKLELHIRAVDSGVMSNYWFEKARPNDLLRLSGPLGTFFLREISGVNLIFLATGTGIAPVKAMLESLGNYSRQEHPKSVTVVWGGRCSEDLYLDVKKIAGEFRYVPVHSRPKEGWTGAKGYVQDALLDLMPDLAQSSVYACGSQAMINSAQIRLIEAGLPVNRFYSDAFVSSGTN